MCTLLCVQKPFTGWTENSYTVNAPCSHSRDQSRTLRGCSTQGWDEHPRSVQACGSLSGKSHPGNPKWSQNIRLVQCPETA